MLPGRVQKSRIEIPVPSKPRPYRPGDGPALVPITLSLKNDTDAFVIDKRVLPGKSVHGELKLEMYYVVGWPDLPAARVVIDAKHIYDYVSPRTLEDFEYKLTLEREDEELRREAKKARQKAKAAAKALPPPSTPPASTTPRITKALTQETNKKKRGRPSKADLLARKMAQQTSVDENAEVSLPPMSTSGPSLSTPKKKRLAVVAASEVDTDGPEGAQEENEDLEDEADPGEAIFKQLYSEASAAGRSREGTAKSIEIEIPSRAVYQAASPQKPTLGGSKQSTPVHPRPQPRINQNRSASGPRTAPVQKTTLQNYGFTPAGRSSGKWPTYGPSPDPNASASNAKAEPAATAGDTPTAGGNSNSSAKPPRKRKRAVSDQNLWEVKRLEDDRVEEASDGTRRRFFKVRWKGHWPPDENPTWEPEENILRKLVRDYLRRKAGKSGKASTNSRGKSSSASAATAGDETRRKTPKSVKRAPAPLSFRKYSSVSEAFEDGVEEDAGADTRKHSSRASSSGVRGSRVDVEIDSDDDDDEHDDGDDYDDGGVEQLVVTEEQRQEETRRSRRRHETLSTPALSLPSLPKAEFDATLARELEASFGSSVHRRHQQQRRQQHSESSES